MALWETCPNLQTYQSAVGRGRVLIWGRAESKVQTAFYCSEATISDMNGSGSASRRNELHQEAHYACHMENPRKCHVKMFKCLYICVSKENRAGRQVINADF
jgi:hypothetical protein